MADRDSEPEHTTEEQKLQKQIESIYLDYQKVVNTETMAPKDANTRKIETNNSDDGIEDDDLEEIASVANNLDSLNSALDSIEEQADRIRAQLLELLTSNREIRQSIREENEKLQEKSDDLDDASESGGNQLSDNTD